MGMDNTTPTQEKKNRGFRMMDPEVRRRIASAGGRAAHARGVAHEFTPAEAKAAGRRGGQKIAMDRTFLAEIGRRGGISRSEVAQPEPRFLILSIPLSLDSRAGIAWYLPSARGYTSSVNRAGRYTQPEAEAHCSKGSTLVAVEEGVASRVAPGDKVSPEVLRTLVRLAEVGRPEGLKTLRAAAN